MKNPAESIAGTTPTSSVVFSAGPKFVGRLLTIAPPPVAIDEDGDEGEEQPAANPTAAVSAAAHAAARPNLLMPVNEPPLS
jgi:hypothetical protein